MAEIDIDRAWVTHIVRNEGSNLLSSYMVRRRARQVRRVDSLKDVSLYVGEGCRLGLIGANGAGKSTMLRMMSGIYPPTRGRISISGHVSSLLDLSLGMDPESSGLVNIRNRALFLGLSRKEVDAQIDDIATFADLGEFISYPIRTYSSGMFLRLAFAIATASHPEIVLIDEGLGAGDAAFRDKARARLDDFMGRAGILVLASHDYALLERYCDEAAVMHKGRLLFRGPLKEAHDYYRSEVVG